MAEIKETSPRTNVYITLPDKRIMCAPLGTKLKDIIASAYPEDPYLYLAALCDNVMHTLNYAPRRDVFLEPLTRKHELGRLVYNRSLVLLMVTAFKEVFPEQKVFTDYRRPMGGLFCRTSSPVSREDLKKVEDKMREMVNDDIPVDFEEKTIEEGEKILLEEKEEDKIYFLKTIAEKAKKNTAWFVRVGKYFDYFHGPLVVSMGYLRRLALRSTPSGFILVPSQTDVKRAEAMAEKVTLVDAAFRRAVKLANQLEVGTVPQLNEIIKKGETHEGILVSESAQSSQITAIAREIAERGAVKLVLIAGPSSSGKTTFSKRLAIALQTCGIKPVTLEMDRYFVERDKTPRDEKGEYDFESIHAMDLTLLDHDLNELIAGREVTLPKYDFITGTRSVGPKLRLKESQILIAEGIHGLNPLLTQGIPAESIFRIYISPLTPLNLDRHHHISTSDSRMIRRIVRDARTRGHSAEQTIMRWASIRRGEYKNIFPYQEQADAIFNSMFLYELCVLKPIAEPLLLQISKESPAYPKADSLLRLLSFFEPMGTQLIPENSILREFVGGSSLERYLPGQFESYWSIDN